MWVESTCQRDQQVAYDVMLIIVCDGRINATLFSDVVFFQWGTLVCFYSSKMICKTFLFSTCYSIPMEFMKSVEYWTVVLMPIFVFLEWKIKGIRIFYNLFLYEALGVTILIFINIKAWYIPQQWRLKLKFCSQQVVATIILANQNKN